MTLLRFLLLWLGAMLSGPVMAQPIDYPDRPVRLIVPFAAGGGVDVVARTLGQSLSEKFGQPVVIENRPGASGNVGASVVLQAPGDGYTLLLSASTFAVNPVIAAERPNYDPIADFRHLALIAKGPLLFIVHPSAADSLADFMKRAKAAPDKYNLATGGYGSAGHMSAEALKLQGGLSIPVVLYRGTAPVFADLLGGHISGLLDPLVTSLPLAQSGQVKALAISADRRSPLAPDVPTFAESGFGAFEFYTGYGVWAQKSMPAALADRISAAVREVGAQPAMAQWFRSQGLEFSGIGGDDFVAFERQEQTRYEEIMKRGNLTRQ
jgi:tripartite-type tricarboxylate transporter receptor subunit TctC